MTRTLNCNDQFSALKRYGMAAGALGAVGLPAEAADQPYNPVEGLPITIDSTTMTAFDIDLDGNALPEFRVFYDSLYGGGFSIFNYFRGDAAHRVRGFQPGTSVPAKRSLASRFDAGEPISRGNISSNPSPFVQGTLSIHQSVSKDGSYGDHIQAYRPFVGTPGFISLIYQSDSGTAGVSPNFPQVAYLEVVVSPDGSELQILSGGRDDSALTIDLPDVTPPPAAKGAATGLAELAIGKDD